MSLRRIAPKVGAAMLLLAGPVVGAVTARIGAAVPEPAPTPVASAPADEATEVARPEAPGDAGAVDDERPDEATIVDEERPDDDPGAATRRRTGVEDTAGDGNDDDRDGRGDGAPDTPTDLGRGTAPGDTAAPPPALAGEGDDGDVPSVPPEDVERLLDGDALTQTDRLILERLEKRNRLTLLFPKRL